VRRIEALTGPEAVQLVREHDRELGRDRRAVADDPAEALSVVRAARSSAARLEAASRRRGRRRRRTRPSGDRAERRERGGGPTRQRRGRTRRCQALAELADRIKGQLHADGVIVLATQVDDRASASSASRRRFDRAASARRDLPRPQPRSSARRRRPRHPRPSRRPQHQKTQRSTRSRHRRSHRGTRQILSGCKVARATIIERPPTPPTLGRTRVSFSGPNGARK